MNIVAQVGEVAHKGSPKTDPNALEFIVDHELLLEQTSKVLLQITPAQILHVVKDKHDLVLTFLNGDTLRIVNFYIDGQPDSELFVLNDDGAVVQALLSGGEGELEVQYVPVDEGSDDLGLLALGLLGLGGLAAGLALGLSDDDDESGKRSPKTDPSQGVLKVEDDVQPITGELHSGDVTDDTQPEFSGSDATKGLTITLYDGDTVIGSTVVDENGNWSITPSTALSEGDHNFVVVATDAAGNEVDSTPFALTVDTTPPADPQVAVMDDVGPVKGPLANGDVTDDSQPTFSGVGTPGDTIKLYDGDTLITTTEVDQDGNWSITPPPLTDGTHNFGVTASDPAGNESEMTPFTLTVDTVAPDAPTMNVIEDNDTVISGTAEPDSTVNVDVNGDHVGDYNTPVGDDGQWSVDIGTPLDAGTNVNASATDPAGNTGPETTQIVTTHVDPVGPDAPVINGAIDDVEPNVGNLASGDSTNDTTPTLTGTAEPDGTVTVYDNGSEVGTAAVDSNGNWSFTPATGISDGQHSFTATVTDANDSVSEPSTPFNLTVDTVPPIDADVEITGIHDDTGVAGDFITGDQTLTVYGTVEGLAEGETVQVSTDGGANWHDAEVTGNSWSYVDGRTLADGEYTYQARVVDAAGNVGDIDSQTVIVDTSLPPDDTTVDITAIETDTGVVGDFITSDTSLTVSGTITGTLATDETVQISTDGGATWQDTNVSGNSWSYVDGRTLTEGEHTYDVRVVDVAGNVGNTDSQTVIIDTTPPDPQIVVDITAIETDSGVVGDFITNDTSLTVKGTITGGALAADETVQISTDGGATWNDTVVSGDTWSYVDGRTLTEGEHTYDVRIVDAAGNVGDTDSQKVIIDTTPPDPELVVDITGIETDTGVVGDFITSDDTLTVTGTIAGGTLAADETVQISTDGGATWQNVDVSGNSWSYVDDRTLTEGEHTYDVRVVDAAGNVGSTDSQVVIIDKTAPTADVEITGIQDDTGAAGDFITSDQTLTVHGSVEDLGEGETVQVSTDGGLTWHDADVSGNEWSYVDDRTLSDGVYTYQARVVDSAGNVGDTDTQKVTVDTTPPSDPIASLIDTSLLGLVGGNVLFGLLNLGGANFGVMDPDNDIVQVNIDATDLLNEVLNLLGGNNILLPDLAYSSALADELGLNVVVSDDGNQMQITSKDGGPIDNMAINEFLSSVYFDNNSLLNAGVLPNVTVTAIDSRGAAVSDSDWNLANASVLSGDERNPNIHEGTPGNDQLIGDDNNEQFYGYAGDDQLSGAGGNDLLRGGEGNDTLNGGAGDDVLIDGNGQDTFYGGDGDDYIIINGTDFASIDGGTGFDVLALDDGISLNSADFSGPVNNIEAISMSEDNEANTLTLTADAVQVLTDENNELYIMGDSNDTLNIVGAEFVGPAGGDENSLYNVYNFGDSILYVEDDVNVVT